MKQGYGVLAVWLACLLFSPAQAQYGPVAQKLQEMVQMPYGYQGIDWQNKRYSVVAIGAYDPRKAGSPAMEKERAKQVAIILAEERILMLAMGTRVSTGKAMVTHGAGLDFELRAKFMAAGILERVTIDSVVYKKHNEDGSLYAIAYVSAPMLSFNRIRELADQEMNIQREIDRIWDQVGLKKDSGQMTKSDAYAVASAIGQELKQTFDEDRPNTPKVEPLLSSASNNYTGLIVDARHLKGTEMAVLARVVTPTLRRVYGHEDVSRNVALDASMVSFASSIEDAYKVPNIGNNPMVVQATAIRPGFPNHLIVPEEMGSKIVAGGGGKDGFLSQARVVFVY